MENIEDLIEKPKRVPWDSWPSNYEYGSPVALTDKFDFSIYPEYDTNCILYIHNIYTSFDGETQHNTYFLKDVEEKNLYHHFEEDEIELSSSIRFGKIIECISIEERINVFNDEIEKRVRWCSLDKKYDTWMPYYLFDYCKFLKHQQFLNTVCSCSDIFNNELYNHSQIKNKKNNFICQHSLKLTKYDKKKGFVYKHINVKSKNKLNKKMKKHFLNISIIYPLYNIGFDPIQSEIEKDIDIQVSSEI